MTIVMKRFVKVKVLVMSGSVLGVILIAVLVYLFVSFPSATASGQAQAPVACHTIGVHHTVTIASGIVQPPNIQAKLCDSLTIVNTDNTVRAMAFGPHTQHIPYDGVTFKLLNQGQSMTITLNQAGLFEYHDHLNPEVGGQFKVIP